MKTYTQRLENSKKSPSSALFTHFANLVTELGVAKQDTDVLTILDHEVRFCPLLVPPSEHVREQAACFAALVEYWCSTPEPVDLLTVDVSDATMSHIKMCMQGVAVEDVVRGIRIWETLPCKIHKIVIYEPVGMAALCWTMRRLTKLLLPRKVSLKIQFAKKAHVEVPHQDADANDDVVASSSFISE